MARIEPINLGTLNVTGIANIREIVNDINQSIDRIQNAGDERVADILKEIGLTVVTDARMENRARREIIETLRTLAHEAGLPPAERQPGIVKEALAYIPLLLSTDLNLLHYFMVHSRDLERFFGIFSSVQSGHG